MKVRFSNIRQSDGFHIVDAQPTTKVEKQFIDSAFIISGVCKPWVYERLLDAADYYPGSVIDNPLEVVYDEFGELYDIREYCNSVLDDEMLNHEQWYNNDMVAYALPYPSTICLLSLYDFFENKRYHHGHKKLGKLRRLSRLKKKIDNLSAEYYAKPRWSIIEKEEKYE